MSFATRLLAASLTLLGALPAPAQEQSDFDLLSQSAIDLGPPAGALPGEVLAFGPSAFVVASVGAPAARRGVIAAARHGEGRVVAFGHNAFLGGWQAEGFVSDAIHWAAQMELDDTALLVLGGGLGLEKALRSQLDIAERRTALPSADQLERFNVVAWAGGDLGDEELDRLEAFVRAGGGLLFGVCPWGRQQVFDGQGKGLSIRTDLSHNRLARRFGLVFGADTAGGGGYFVDSAANAELQAFVALSRVLGNLNPTPTERALKSAGQGRPLPTRPGDARLVAALLRALPPNDDSVLPRVQAALQASDLTAHVPSAGHPIPQTDAAGYLGMLLSTTTWAELDAAEVPAAPGADFFPGAVPTRAPRLATELIFPADLVQRGGWLSTGHFAAPGEVVSLRVLNGSANGWSLRIGAHRDTLWHKDTWSRWPEITLERALPAELDDDAFEVASPFGGLVYLVPGPKAKAARFELSGVVEAPYFVLGDATSAADWLRRREAPAPWGELACDGVILTLPSGALRGLDDPVALMTWWNEAMACYPELRGEPQPARPERMVEDIQISAGWMHSGYPVMTHGADDTESSAAVDLATLQSKGNWGYFHEFGHNAQKRDWTFGGTGEVTNNLFSLYLGERMAGIEPWENPWLAGQKKKPAAYFERGADFAEWKRSPGLALMMYAEVQRAFGWEPFQVAMLSYLELAPNERPRSDDEKRDRWLIELSRASARNLGPYFERWGVPTSAAARAEVAELEGWMPASYR